MTTLKEQLEKLKIVQDENGVVRFETTKGENENVDKQE